MITAVRCCESSSKEYIPFGNSRVRDVFKDFNFGENISEDNELTKVLLLGCGDLRNTFQAMTTKNPRNLEIHLNDFHPSVLARNVIILKIISSPDFNFDDDEDFGFLWDVWFVIDWSDKTRNRFLLVLKELIDEILPVNISIPNNSHLKKLKNLWNDWYLVLSWNETDSKSLLKKGCEQRDQCLLIWWETYNPGYLQKKAKLENTDLLTSSANELADQFVSREGIIGLTPCVKKKIYNEVLNCYREGSCRLQHNVKPVCANPTFLEPQTNDCEVSYLTPFEGYLPMAKSELLTSGERIITQSCSEMLKNLMLSYRKRIQTVNIVFHLEEAVEFCYLDANKFDVIDCSNFVDDIGLANLLLACCQRLSNNPNAILYTEIITDKHHSANNIVETSLCAPLSMIPTIYGLRLADHVELRDSAVDYLRCNSRQRGRPVNLCWQRVPPFQNIKLVPSPVLNECLTKLAKLCHLTDQEVNEFSETRSFGNEFYTPQTFSCILDSMIQRLGHTCYLTDIRQFDVTPQFNLAIRTLEDWKNGKKMQKFSAGVQSMLESTVLENRAALLRLAFVPKHSLFYLRKLSIPDVHFIDNLHLEFEDTPNGMKVETVSFLLSLDHGLDETTYEAIIVNVWNGRTLFILDSIESMRVEEYNLPYPIGQSKSSQLPLNKEMPMIVKSCIESEDQYILEISIECNGNVSGLKVTTNEKAPCESCHDITVSLNQPSQIKPLAISFPFPILATNLQATLHRKSRHIDLVLKKSLQEPWPCEFHTSLTSKWIIDDLVPWENSPSNRIFNTIEHHLASQFSSLEEMDAKKSLNLNQCSALLSLRSNLVTMMTIKDVEYVSYGRNNERYLLKLHYPLLTSPKGCPILLITALDDNQAKNITKRKTPKNVPIIKEFADHTMIYNKVFPFGPLGYKEQLELNAETEEEFHLFRFLLRLNSTRIEPSKWQKKSVPLGGSSPWLATFLSPLYQDLPTFVSPDNMCFTCIESVDYSDNEKCCATCKKTPEKLKCCSRCRSTVYCSVECQRSHWSTHKLDCKKV